VASLSLVGWRDWILIGLTALVLAALIRGTISQSHLVAQGKQAHDYLCYQKQVAIPRQINSSLNFETAIQEGRRVPIPGITTEDIATSVKRDEDTLRALSRVHC